jgi:hypothetical protein
MMISSPWSIVLPMAKSNFRSTSTNDYVFNINWQSLVFIELWYFCSVTFKTSWMTVFQYFNIEIFYSIMPLRCFYIRLTNVKMVYFVPFSLLFQRKELIYVLRFRHFWPCSIFLHNSNCWIANLRFFFRLYVACPIYC